MGVFKNQEQILQTFPVGAAAKFQIQTSKISFYNQLTSLKSLSRCNSTSASACLTSSIPRQTSVHSRFSCPETATLLPCLPILFFLKSLHLLIATFSHISVIPTRLELCSCTQITVFFSQAACIFQGFILQQSLKAKQKFNL